MPVKQELLRQDQCLHSRGLEPLRGVTRVPPVGAPGGELFSLWGKLLRRRDFCFPVPLHFLICRSFYARSLYSRLKWTLELAQPSMAKRLKTGAASKQLGL